MSRYPGISQYESGLGRVSLFQMFDPWQCQDRPAVLTTVSLRSLFRLLPGLRLSDRAQRLRRWAVAPSLSPDRATSNRDSGPQLR